MFFQNKLKKETIQTINTLKNADVDCLMITGDSLLTACNVSFFSGIVDHNYEVFLAKLKDNDISW